MARKQAQALGLVAVKPALEQLVFFRGQVDDGFLERVVARLARGEARLDAEHFGLQRRHERCQLIGGSLLLLSDDMSVVFASAFRAPRACATLADGALQWDMTQMGYARKVDALLDLERHLVMPRAALVGGLLELQRGRVFGRND